MPVCMYMSSPFTYIMCGGHTEYQSHERDQTSCGCTMAPSKYVTWDTVTSNRSHQNPTHDLIKLYIYTYYLLYDAP